MEDTNTANVSSQVSSLSSSTSNSNVENTQSRPVSSKWLRYPMRRIENKSDYLEIRIVEYKAPGFGDDVNVPFSYEDVVNNKTQTIEGNISLSTIKTGTEANRNLKPLKYIYLPIPQNLSDTSTVTWGDDTLNPLEAFGLKTASNIVGGGLDAGRVAIKQFFGAAGSIPGLTKQNKDLISGTIGGALYNALGGNVNLQSIVSRATGQILNPNLELLFQGSNIRSFPFVFEFSPRDRRESLEVKEIIKAFKIHMTPKNTSTGNLGKVFIKSPDVFLIRYRSGNKDHPFLNRFKPCALVDMSISYTGSNTYATYQDGTPVHIQMTLTFKELNPIYSEDYTEDPEGQIGVGY